jgi:transcriptional regulator of acetoin/glycerol metabolism
MANLREASREMKKQEPSKPVIIPLSLVKRDAILAAVVQLNGNVSLAASKLGISKKTLYRKLKKYGIVLNEGRQRAGRRT